MHCDNTSMEREPEGEFKWLLVRFVVRLYCDGELKGFWPYWTEDYLREITQNKLYGYSWKIEDVSGTFNLCGWASLTVIARVLCTRGGPGAGTLPYAVQRRQIRTQLQALHSGAVAMISHRPSAALAHPMFVHMNAFMDGRCIVSSLLHVREDLRSQQIWVQQRVANGVEELRKAVTNVDAEWEAEDAIADAESTAAERMKPRHHGRIPGSGHLCVPGAGGSEPVAEREPARDGPECAPAASAALPAETTT